MYPALCHLYKVENQVKPDDEAMCDKTVIQKNKTVTNAKVRVVIMSWGGGEEHPGGTGSWWAGDL